MINSYRPPVQSQTKSQRWITTTESSLKDVADKLETADRVSSSVMKERKLNNNKTVICFGHDQPTYISDAAENQRKILDSSHSEDPVARKQRLRKLKSDLTATNFILGDDVNLYVRQTQDPAALQSGRATLSKDVQEFMKKSSLHFGNDKVEYQSTAHQAMDFKNTNDYSKMKSEVKSMTVSLRKHNFSFGEDVPDYHSCAATSFIDYSKSELVPESKEGGGGGIRKQGMGGKEDSRRSHFSLGLDKVHYESNTQTALNLILSSGGVENIAQNKERAREMKMNLLKTSVLMGDDDSYM